MTLYGIQIILCDFLANTTLNENSAEACSDWLTNSCFVVTKTSMVETV